MADYILRIEYDSECDCPSEDECSWQLVSFNRRSIHFDKTGEYLEPSIGLRKKLSVGLAFRLSYYEHGAGEYSLVGEGMNCPWDSVRSAGILVWNHGPKAMGAKSVADRAKDARSFLDAYNAWMNGWGKWYSLETVEGELVDSCGGFLSDESMRDCIAGFLNPGDRVQIVGDAAFSLRLKGVEVVDEFEEVSL